MTWPVALVWIALILSFGGTISLAIWARESWLAWKYMHMIEIAKAVRSRSTHFGGKHTPENTFDRQAEVDRDARNQHGRRPFVAVDNSEPPPPKGAA